ncbi:hypothetical protein QAD02_015799 [Eretmocerus hayati]|uniref:Uncharacterized protein n=1 Tax=Eretmocerus hayati TaxID=131215 RepID=A0ACC2P991_9HYME|nr:hypothetical protein QAD02_015799 [Eretmocerus hayati]
MCDDILTGIRDLTEYRRTSLPPKDTSKDMVILKLYHEYLTWNEARKFCIAEGGQLATIRSREEAEIMASYNRETDTGRKPGVVSNGVFLGFHDYYHLGEWVTIRGEPLSKTGYSTITQHWGGPPADGHFPDRPPKCGELAFDGGLNDAPCSSKRRFICELPEQQKP